MVDLENVDHLKTPPSSLELGGVVLFPNRTASRAPNGRGGVASKKRCTGIRRTRIVAQRDALSQARMPQ
jgi:hypothetical protein